MTFPVDPRIKDKVQTEVKTTTSALPLVVNDIVLGYINYFNGRGHKTIETGLERAGKYRAMISRILAEEGRPSGIDPSRAGRIRLYAPRGFPRRRRGYCGSS